MATFIKKIKERPKRLLVTRTDRIGDFVLTLPLFEAIKKHLKMELVLLCQEMTAPLAKNNPFIDEIIAINDKVKPANAAVLIKNHGVDGVLVVVADPLIRAILPHLKEIPFRMGPVSKPSLFFQYSHPVIQKRSRSLHNEAWYNLELLEAFGIGIEDPRQKEIRPKIYFTIDELERAAWRLAEIAPGYDPKQPYLILHAGMSGSALNWPKEHYKALLKSLLEAGQQVMLTGHSDQEKELNADLREGLSAELQAKCFDLTGKLPLRQLAAVMKEAALFIGPSTGPTHVANAAGAKIISFYPPIKVQSQTRWEPYLADSHIFVPFGEKGAATCGQKFKCRFEACSHHPCMATITPEEVHAKAMQMSACELKKG